MNKTLTYLIAFLLWMPAIVIGAQDPGWVKRLEVTGFNGGVESVIICPNSESILVTDGEGLFHIHNIRTLERIKSVHAHQQTINMVFFYNNGRNLITAGDDGFIKIWTYPEFNLTQTIEARFNRVAFAVPGGHPGGVVYGGYKTGRSGTYEGINYVEAPKDEKPPKQLFFHRSRYYNGTSYGVTDGLLSEDQKHILFGDGFAVFAMNRQTLKKTDSIPVRYVVNNLGQKGDRLYVWSQGFVEYFSISPALSLNAKSIGILSLNQEEHSARAGYSRFAISKRWLATGNVKGWIYLLDPHEPKLIHRWQGHKGVVPALTFVPGDSLLITGGADGNLIVWGPPLPQPPPPAQMEISPEPPPLAEDGKVRIEVAAAVEKPQFVLGRRTFEQKELSLSPGEWELIIWDRHTVDGDSVNVLLNDKFVLKEHLLTAQQQKFALPLAPGDYYLILFALNLGSSPPNTAGIRLKKGDEVHEFDINSDLKRSAMVRLRVREQ